VWNKANDTLYDTDIKLYKGRDYILEEMEGLKFSINAKSFYQTNSDQAYELYKNQRFCWIDRKRNRVWRFILERELLLSLFLKAKKVIGVESVPDAIKDAKANGTQWNSQIVSSL
jgi:23S rRNA (uracil1939-C5)-methyltransferase